MAGPDDKTKEGQQPQAKTIEIEADAPLEAVEITLTDDGEGTAVETKDDGKQPEKPERKKQQPGRFQQKINQERALRSEAETTAQRLQRENEELRQRLEKTSSDFDVTNRAAFNNHADNVEARLKLAKQDLVAATNAGDAERIAEATGEVSKWGAEQARVESWKRAHPEPTDEERREQQRAKPADEPKPQADQQRQQRFTPELQAFLDRSPWFTPGTKAAPNDEFDVDMHTEARNFATSLERRYKRDGREKEIGSEGYYADIEKHMQAEFPDYEWGDGGVEEDPPARGAMPKMNGDQRQISERSASNGTPQRQSANSNKVTLSGEQRSFVRGMVDQGAYGNNPKTGKAYTYAEAEVRYAREVMKDREIQRQKAGG